MDQVTRSVFTGLIPGNYAGILADPPWRFDSYTALQVENWDSRRDVDKHYETMTPEEIAALPVKSLAAKDAHLFLWITGPNLPQAFAVIEAWGFRYSSIAFCWVKMRRSLKGIDRYFQYSISEEDMHVGLGLTTRHNVELCLLARRGNAKRLDKGVREVILAPAREHSRKPDQVYDRIEVYCAGPYLELFSRSSPRPGWAHWGAEVGRFR